MRKSLLLIPLVAVGLAVCGFYMTGIIGCSPPRTSIAIKKAYSGPVTQLSAPEDWPRWRGPRGDQISRENAPDKFDKLNVLWEAEVGLGYSSPIGARGRIFLFTMHDLKEVLTCFDAVTGQIIWSVEGGEGFHKSYHGTRATPAIDGSHIYTYGGRGELICRELSDGKQAWRTNVVEELGNELLDWGVASSPLIDGNLIFVQTGKGGPVAAAIDKNSGKIVWKSQSAGLGGYAAPIIADVAGTRQLIVFAGDAIVGMNPAGGQTLWSYPWATKFGVNASSPVYHEGKLFVSSAYDYGCIQLQLAPSGATKVWENKNIMSRFQGAILDNGYLYANSEVQLVCVSWADGSLKWKTTDSNMRLDKGGSMLRIGGDKLLTLSERGKLSLMKATPQGISLLGQIKEAVEGKEVWSTPLVYGQRVYVKGAQELICLELK